MTADRIAELERRIARLEALALTEQRLAMPQLPARESILALLADGRAWHLAAIKQRLTPRFSPDTIDSRLSEMARAGAICRVRYGVYMRSDQ